MFNISCDRQCIHKHSLWWKLACCCKQSHIAVKRKRPLSNGQQWNCRSHCTKRKQKLKQVLLKIGIVTQLESQLYRFTKSSYVKAHVPLVGPFTVDWQHLHFLPFTNKTTHWHLHFRPVNYQFFVSMIKLTIMKKKQMQCCIFTLISSCFVTEVLLSNFLRLFNLKDDLC